MCPYRGESGEGRVVFGGGDAANEFVRWYTKPVGNGLGFGLVRLENNPRN